MFIYASMVINLKSLPKRKLTTIIFVRGIKILLVHVDHFLTGSNTAIENKDNRTLGIDMGAVRFSTFLHGRYEDTIKTLTITELDKRIAVLQKKTKNKEKCSKRRLKNVKRISRLHKKKGKHSK